MTPNEISKLAHAVPKLWAYRHRVIEFVESPRAEQVMKQALESAWLGTGEYAAELDDTDANISMRESMLTYLPAGEEAISIRGNLLLTQSQSPGGNRGGQQATQKGRFSNVT